MHNVLITTFPREWDASEILSFLEMRDCEVSMHYPEGPLSQDDLSRLLNGVDGIIPGGHPFTRRPTRSFRGIRRRSMEIRHRHSIRTGTNS